MALSNDVTEVVNALFALVEDHAEEFGIGAMHYGDQSKIVTGNTVCFEVESKTKTLKNSPRGMDVMFTVYVLVYTAKVQSPEMNREESDRLAQQIETVLDEDGQLGGLLIHGYVSRLESGYSVKSDSIVRSSRLTYEGRSQTRLPS